MSFLTKTSGLYRTAAISATRLPTTYYSQRHFTSTSIAQKTATDSVKDGLKKVDRTVSDNIVLPAVDAVGSCAPFLPPQPNPDHHRET